MFLCARPMWLSCLFVASLIRRTTATLLACQTSLGIVSESNRLRLVKDHPTCASLPCSPANRVADGEIVAETRKSLFNWLGSSW